jgi:ketosteroid isomerase-like protein
MGRTRNGDEQKNIALVKEQFAAVARGDLEFLLGTLAEDVEWWSPVTRCPAPEMPWATPRRGRQQVAGFFREMAEHVLPAAMEPLAWTAEGDRVVVEGRNRGIVRATGLPYEHDWVIIYSFVAGKVTRFAHYYDTADLLRAMRR